MPTYTTTTTGTFTLTATTSTTATFRWSMDGQNWHTAPIVRGTAVINPRPPPLVRGLPTPEQLAEEAAVLAQERLRTEQQRTERRAAQERARTLLLSALTPEQRTQYETREHFTVDTPDGRRFRIQQGRSMNVEELGPDGRVLARYCAHPRPTVPDEDTMLAQLLFLRHDPATFLRIANRSPVGRVPAVA